MGKSSREQVMNAPLKDRSEVGQIVKLLKMWLGSCMVHVSRAGVEGNRLVNKLRLTVDFYQLCTGRCKGGVLDVD